MKLLNSLQKFRHKVSSYIDILEVDYLKDLIVFLNVKFLSDCDSSLFFSEMTANSSLSLKSEESLLENYKALEIKALSSQVLDAKSMGDKI